MMTGAVERALWCLGRGFDAACDFLPKYCEGKERVILVDEEARRELLVPGFGVLPSVSVDVKCDKGDRIRYQPDVLDFNGMSELFNQRSSLAGKIPSGLFNSMFAFERSSWARDASRTKCLTMDGYFISLFNLRIKRQPFTLSDRVIKAVPSSWDPMALARFIESYGTHVIVGLSVGGQDVIYVKQDQSSNLSPSDLKKHLHTLGDQLFSGTCPLSPLHRKAKEHKLKFPEAFNVFDTQPRLTEGTSLVSCKDGVTVIYSKRGGDTAASSHCEWLLTVPSKPEVISFTFIPITSLLKSVPGIGFLSHAINLYLRYKPPIEELHYFLDFQSQKMWAPMHNDLPLGPSSIRSMEIPALQFNPMGPKLYVNTTQVIVKSKPVTGLRLHLEGKKNDRLAIHLEHLSNTPTLIPAQANKAHQWRGSEAIGDERYYKPVQWKKLSHVCIVPVKYDPQWPTAGGGGTAFIVTGAQLHVQGHRPSTVLHLRLLFSEVPGCIIAQSRWEQGQLGFSHRLGFFSTLATTKHGGGVRKERQKGPVAVVDSGVFPTGPPVPVGTQKLLRFVNTTHICKGVQDSPGYWLVTGAKLDVVRGRIGLHVKFSLLASVS